MVFFIVFTLHTTTSYAFDVSILKNDKELNSHVYSERSLDSAKNFLKEYGFTEDLSRNSLVLLGQVASSLKKSKNFCDINLYREFMALLKNKGLPSTPETFKNILILWRAENKIDDIFFEIMVNVANLNQQIELTNADPYEAPIFSASDRAVVVGLNILKNKELKDVELQSAYKKIKGANLSDLKCTTDAWRGAAQRLAPALYEMNALAYFKGIISSSEYQLVEFYRKNKVHRWPITLNHYLAVANEAKNSARPKNPPENYLTPNKQSSRVIYRSKKTTYRKSLYMRFDSIQIILISNLLKQTYSRMDATKAEIVITHKQPDTNNAIAESYVLSPMEQYRMASRMLRKDIVELQNSSLFNGQVITHEDLITASLETGLISENDVDLAMKVDDLWNPYVPKWKKIANFAYSITGTATIFLPPPFNVVSSIILVTSQGQLMKRFQKPDSRNNPNVIF